MTATVIDLGQRRGDVVTRTRKTIDLIRAYRGLDTDAAFAEATGIPRSKIQRVTAGPTRLTIDVLAVFAAALDVDDYVLSMQPDDAMRWVIDHAPNGPDQGPDLPTNQSGWIYELAGQAA